MNIEKLKVI